MKKQGQVTLFIIIGVIALILAAFIFYFRGIGTETDIKLSVEAQPLDNYITSCLESTLVGGIQLVGLQGGYAQILSPALVTDYSTVAYHYYDGNYTAPSKEEMESQISFFVENALELCLDDFTSFRSQGYEIEIGELSAEIRGNASVELSEYMVTAPVRLGHVYDISKLITSKTINDPEWIDMTFLSEFDVNVDILPFDDDSFVYSISDHESMIKGEPYVFLFANHFVVNKAPMLNIPDELIFMDGEAAIYQVGASDPEGDDLVFFDDTAMFDITEDGVILFTPEVPGEYDVTISVEDGHNSEVSKVVKFIIKDQ